MGTQEASRTIGGRRRIRAGLAALALASAVTMVAPSSPAHAATCGGGGAMTGDRWNFWTKTGSVTGVNTCSWTRSYKIDVAGGPDTGCKSIGPYGSTRFDYMAYPWTGYAYARAILAC